MLSSIRKIQQFTEGLSFEQFVADPKAVSAVLYEFIVIGEAARHVPEEACQRYSHIPWSKIGSFRNFLAHVYFNVSLKSVWDTVHSDLAPLIPQLEAILENE